MKGIIIQNINLDKYKKKIYLGCLTESEYIQSIENISRRHRLKKKYLLKINQVELKIESIN